MFQMQVERPGSGDSGRLSVFLRSLGDALAQAPQIDRMYTLVLQAAGTSEIEYGQLHIRYPLSLQFRYRMPLYRFFIDRKFLPSVS